MIRSWVVARPSRCLGGWRNEQTGTIVVQAGEQGQQVACCWLPLNGVGKIASRLGEVLPLTEDYADDSDMHEAECHQFTWCSAD